MSGGVGLGELLEQVGAGTSYIEMIEKALTSTIAHGGLLFGMQSTPLLKQS